MQNENTNLSRVALHANHTTKQMKLFKAKKHWVVAGTAMAAMSLGAVATNAHADEVKTDSTSTLTKQANKIVAPDPDQIAQDQHDIDDTQNALDDAKDQQPDAQTDVDNSQTDVDNAQRAVDDATTQKNADQDTADNLAPDGYQDAESDVKDAQDSVNDAQSDINQDQTDIDKAQNQNEQDQKDVDQAQSDVDKAQDQASDAKNDLDDTKGALDDAKDQLDDTPETITTHHEGGTNQPGTIHDGTPVYDEDDLPTHLVKPSDADQYDSTQKQWEAGGTTDSYWEYIQTDRDHSAIIVDGKLTPAQQQELAQYALTLINDFRKQHGLAPIKMSQLSMQFAQTDADLRAKNGTPTNAHSYNETEVIQSVFPNYGMDSDSMHYYLQTAQNMGFTYSTPNALYDRVTMTYLKVQILQMLQDMAYADADSEWGHRDNMLLTQPNISDTTETLDNIWIGFNLTQPDDMGISSFLIDFYGTFNSENGATDEITSALDTNQIGEYVSKGYDTTDANPAYQTAKANYDKAKSNYDKAQSAYNQAQTAVNQAQTDLGLAQADAANSAKAIANAKTKLAKDQARLADAKTALTKAQAVLDELKAKYADQIPAYEAAKTKVAEDQKQIDTLTAKLNDAKAKLADKQGNLDDINAEIARLEAQLEALKAKLAEDSKSHVIPDENTGKTDSDSSKTDNTNSSSSSANHANSTVNGTTDSVIATGVIGTGSNAGHIVNLSDAKKSTVKDFTKAKSATLPQTDESVNGTASLIGLALATMTFGFIGGYKRKH